MQSEGVIFEVTGKLMRSYEDSFKGKDGKQVEFYGCVIGWIGGKQQVGLTKEAFENLPPEGATVTIEGRLSIFDGKAKLKGEEVSVEASGPSSASRSQRPGEKAA